jgi:hypothetical protein
MSNRGNKQSSAARSVPASTASIAPNSSSTASSSSKRGLPTGAVQGAMLQTKEAMAKGAINDLRERSYQVNDDEDIKSKVKRNRNTERANVATQLQQAALLAAETREAISSFNHVDRLDDKLWADDMNTRTVGMRSLAGQAIHHAEIEERENQIIVDKERSIKRNKDVIQADKTRLNSTLDDMQRLAQEYAEQQQQEESAEIEDPDDA